MMKRFYTLLIASLLVVSCSTEKKQEEEKPLIDQVMEVHDAVMPKMGDVMKTKKALMAKADSIASVDSVAAIRLKAIAEDLEMANEAMMDWMRNFDKNFEGTEEEVKSYLEKKKQGIEKVAQLMNEKLEESKKALE